MEEVYFVWTWDGEKQQHVCKFIASTEGHAVAKAQEFDNATITKALQVYEHC